MAAETSRIRLSDGVLADEVSYRLYGNDRAVTQLQLELRGYNRNETVNSQAAFDERALALLHSVVQHDEVTDLYKAARRLAPQEVKSDFLTIEIKSKFWGAGNTGGYNTRLVVTHDRHKLGA